MSTKSSGKRRSSTARPFSVIGPVTKPTHLVMLAKTKAMPMKIISSVNTLRPFVVGVRSPYPTVDMVVNEK
eukprot:4525609-Prymnesium_polylepis.3